MTTRMQQRRGTAAEWLAIDPALAEGELGYETDTGEFRVGDGSTPWSLLSPFKNIADLGGNLDDYIPLTQKGNPEGVATLDVDGQVPASQLGNATVDLTGYATETYVNTAVSNLVDAAPGTLDTLNELAAALGDDANYAATITTALGTKQDKVSGITDTEIGYLDGVTSAIQTQLDGKSATGHTHTISEITDYTPVDISNKQDKVSGVSDTEIGYLANVTSDIQTQLDNKASTSVTNSLTNSVSTLDFELNNLENQVSGKPDNLYELNDVSYTPTFLNNGDVISYRTQTGNWTATRELINSTLVLDTTYQTPITYSAFLPVASVTTAGPLQDEVVITDLVYSEQDGIYPYFRTGSNYDMGITGFTPNESFILFSDTGTVLDGQKLLVTAFDQFTNYPNISITIKHDGDYTKYSALRSLTQLKVTQVDGDYDSRGISTVFAQIDSKASTTYVDSAVAGIIDAAPEQLNTLNELAAALNDDANFATSVTNLISSKANSNSPNFTGVTDFSGIVDFSDSVVVGIDSLPSQTGNAGKYLSTNGTTASWQEAATQTPHPFAMIG